MPGRRPPRASLVASACLVGLALSSPRPVAAQVSEPNGIVAPTVGTGTEISLQAYFDTQQEAINAVSNAAAEPGTFLPLCDFQATLVLSQSNAQAGIAWYNVPTDASIAPAAIYPIGTANLVVGQVITSADVRTNPNYAMGLIGFVLMKNGQRVYYSEYKRNAFCSGCTAPDYWKMALAYQSRRFPNTYYLAFEDWEGANTTTWFGNDGDFNDKVFKISGVTCDGGGESCDTQMPGVCANGVTECQVGTGGTVVCKPTVRPSAEKCDNLDNDCNGEVDDGSGLCRAGEVCVHGTCIPPCGAFEFDCTPPYVCEQGLCVDAACVGKDCPTGQICRGGACVGGCEGVVCPLGQQCQLGVCVDPCAGVECPGAVCDRGACVTHCSCRACDIGKVCAADGHCVDSGCQSMTCPAGQVCRSGACGDACAGAMCPGGVACHDGMCDPPPIIGPGFDGGASGGSSGGLGGRGGSTGTTTGGGGGSSGSTTGGGGSSASDGGSDGGPLRKIKPACGCDAGGGDAGGPGSLAAALLAAALVAAHRRRRARS